MNEKIYLEKEDENDIQKYYEEYDEKIGELSAEWSDQSIANTRAMAYASGGRGMWSDGVWNSRNTLGEERPCLSLPLCRTHVERAVGPMRQSPPSLTVRVEDKEVQKKISGVLRGIERASSASDAYITATELTTICGMGWIEAVIEEESETAENCIRIRTAIDPNSIKIDPNSVSLYGADAEWIIKEGFIDTKKAREEFGDDVETNIGKNSFVYPVPPNSTLDCSYYRIKRNDQGVKMCLITRFVGGKAVKHIEYPASYLPIVPTYGKRISGNGKQRYAGMIHFMSDANTAINISASNVMESLASSTRVRWLSAEGTTEDFSEWDSPNQNHTKLTYKQTDVEGNMAPPPREIQVNIGAEGYMQTASFFQALLGDLSGVSDVMRSGISSMQASVQSIGATIETSELSSSDTFDHVNASITQLGRAIVELLPIVYDSKRVIILVDEFGNSKKEKLDLSTILDPETMLMLEVEINSGPSNAVKTKKALASIEQMYTMNPEKGALLLGQYAKLLDLPDQEQFLKLADLMLPPEARNSDPSAIDPQAEQALQMASEASEQKDMTIQYLSAQLAAVQNQLASNKLLADVELYKADLKFKTDQMNDQTKRDIANLSANQSIEEMQMKIEADHIKHAEVIMKDAFHKGVEHKKQENDLPKVPISIMKEISDAKSNEELKENEEFERKED